MRRASWMTRALAHIQSSPDDDRPSIFTVVEQLGLKLVVTKGPLEGIVIDHVEMPSEN